MLSIFLYAFLIISALNAILITFSKAYLTELGKSTFDISLIQSKVYNNDASLLEIIMCYFINLFKALKNIWIYVISGVVVLIAYLVGLFF